MNLDCANGWRVKVTSLLLPVSNTRPYPTDRLLSWHPELACFRNKPRRSFSKDL